LVQKEEEFIGGEDIQIIDISQIDYSPLDRPNILTSLFHPTPEWGISNTKTPAQDVLIPVEKDIMVGGRFHMVGNSAPNILFFHGNGEIVADYDEMGPLYNRIGINFLPVDYRGYGRSNGKPTITAMMRDCHLIFDFVKKWLDENAYSGPFVVMGRSLGSASVLELVNNYKGQIEGLIVESGFAFTGPLLQLLGINTEAIRFREEMGFRNIDKIRDFEEPTLIIHAEYDHIIPLSDGQALYNVCLANDKTLLKIPGANHNNIFTLGLSEYMASIKTLVEKIS